MGICHSRLKLLGGIVLNDPLRSLHVVRRLLLPSDEKGTAEPGFCSLSCLILAPTEAALIPSIFETSVRVGALCFDLTVLLRLHHCFQ